jgi:hypothetical protein
MGACEELFGAASDVVASLCLATPEDHQTASNCTTAPEEPASDMDGSDQPGERAVAHFQKQTAASAVDKLDERLREEINLRKQKV